MKRSRVGCVLAAAVALAPGWACAQEASPFVATLAAGVEGFGQSVGDAIVGGSSVFVTATGHADLPAPLTEAYLVNIEGRSASAVEAQRLREQRLAAAQAAAARFGVSVEVGPTAFSRENDFVAQQRRRNQVAAERLAHPGTPIVEPVSDDADRVFVARTGVRFRAADARTLPAFLDALTAAGIDSPSGALAGATGVGGLLGRNSEVLGFGSLERVDPAIWDRAGQAAVADARRQAGVLATAASRRLGEVRQVLLLTRSLQGSTANVTVAVRFALAPGA